MRMQIEAQFARDTFSILELAAFRSAPFWDAVAINPDALSDKRVDWSTFVTHLAEGIRVVDEPTLSRIAQSISSAVPDGLDVPAREAINQFAVSLAPRCPCVSIAVEDHGPGFCIARVEVDEGVPCPDGFHRINALVVLMSAKLAGARSMRLLHVETSNNQRSGAYLIELRDEHHKAPGSGSDIVQGVALVGILDVVDLAGFDPNPWFERHKLSRAALLANTPIRWPVVAEFFREMAARISPDAVHQAVLQFAKVTSEVRSLVDTFPNPLSLYQTLFSPQFITELWGPLAPARVVGLGNVIVVRLEVRAPYEGSCELMVLQVGLMEGLTMHMGLPAASTRAHFIEDDGRGATYVLEMPSTHAAVQDPLPSSSTSGVASTISEARGLARASVTQRLGGELARVHDVQTIATLVVDDLINELRAHAAELSLVEGETSRLLHSRGSQDGRLINRTLEYGGTPIAVLRVWTSYEQGGRTLAALDVLVPWLAVALGSAQGRERQSIALVQSQERRAALAQVYEQVLATHPLAVFVVDELGSIEAVSVRARTWLEEHRDRTLNMIATTLADVGTSQMDVHHVWEGSRAKRVIMIERSSDQGSLDDRIKLAAAKWALTPRQRDVLIWLACGLSNKEIAQQLDCSEVSIENHLTTVFRIAGAEGRARLVAKLWNI